MQWVALSREAAELLGAIPSFLDPEDPRPAAEQFNAHYLHGGGWSPMPGLKLRGVRLLYPGDPPMKPLAYTMLPLTGERILVYEYAVVLIMQPNGDWEAARMD